MNLVGAALAQSCGVSQDVGHLLLCSFVVVGDALLVVEHHLGYVLLVLGDRALQRTDLLKVSLVSVGTKVAWIVHGQAAASLCVEDEGHAGLFSTGIGRLSVQALEHLDGATELLATDHHCALRP